jgi:XTP/dITP diphosphohydrolase
MKSAAALSKLVLATRNQDKVAEIREVLADIPVQILSLEQFSDAPEVVEDRDTLEGNAIKKVLVIHWHTDLPAVADDTGLLVDALNGAPGVYSSRFAGPGATYADNVQKLLRMMEGIPWPQRTAEFRTVMALAVNGKTQIVEGKCRGLITRAPCGHNGFGYDPVFFIPELNKTLAELARAEKNRISHRGQALAALRALLAKIA